MRTIRVLEKTGNDGDLSLRIPLGNPNVEYDVLVVLQPKAANGDASKLGWPKDYFEKTFGSIDDDTFFRHPQGELPKPVEID